MVVQLHMKCTKPSLEPEQDDGLLYVPYPY